MGESGGGSSIIYHLTAYCGRRGPPPFKQVISQSPASMYIGATQQEQTFRKFLQLANVTTLDAARNLPSAVLQSANSAQIENSPFGSFIYGMISNCYQLA